jgi:hypothetical protein
MEVPDGRQQKLRVVPELPEPEVTHDAQEAPNLPGLVAVVHREHLAVDSGVVRATDGAATSLRLQHLFVILGSQPVARTETPPVMTRATVLR